MADIVWQNPPPKNTGSPGGKWAPILAALREHPGQWALVREGAASNTVWADFRIRHGIEVTTRKRDDGKFDIYMRAPKAGK